jgi:hypothetical protein
MGVSDSSFNNAPGDLNVETISGQYLDMKTCQQICGQNFDESTSGYPIPRIDYLRSDCSFLSHRTF